MAATYKDERQRLVAQIEEWNSNRLDLFALSQPNEVCRTFVVQLLVCKISLGAVIVTNIMEELYLDRFS